MTDATATPAATTTEAAPAATTPADTGAATTPATTPAAAAPAEPAATIAQSPLAPETPAAETPATAPAATPPAAVAPAAETPAAAAPAKAAEPAGDWATVRKALAGDDPELLKLMERYTSASAFGTAHRELHKKLSAGAAKKAAPETTATPEEIAAWRKENGIPDKPEGYQVVLPEGVKPNVGDNELIDLFKSYAHSANWTPDQLNGMLRFNFETRAALENARSERDQEYREQAQDILRTEFGGDYRRYINAMGNFRDQMPSGMANNLLGGRMADGSLIGDNPMFLKWMVQTAVDFDPAATLLPSGTSNAGKSLSDEIASIDTMMRTDPQKYWKDEAIQARYRDLLEADAKMKARAA